jgi:hypothetical protein
LTPDENITGNEGIDYRDAAACHFANCTRALQLDAQKVSPSSAAYMLPVSARSPVTLLRLSPAPPDKFIHSFILFKRPFTVT